MKRLLAAMTAFFLLTAGFALPALAEEVFTVDDAAGAAASCGDAAYVRTSLTTDKSYLQVLCSLSEAVQVTVSITGPDGGTVYQRDYGVCEGSFRSEDIYLRLDGSETAYQVTLTTGEQVYVFPVHRVMARLRDNIACSVGYPLSSINGSDTWQSATIFSLADMEGSSFTTPIHASGAYTIGTATFSVQGGQLTVSASLDDGVDGSIDGASVKVATTALAAQTLGKKSFSGISGGLDSAIDLSGAIYAAVYLRLTVSFDPSGLPGSPQITLSGQDALWQRMLTETANEAVG